MAVGASSTLVDDLNSVFSGDEALVLVKYLTPIAGPRGSKWFEGTGAPVGNIGQKNDDFYLNLITGDVYLWFNGWNTVGSIKGATGPQGPSGSAAYYQFVKNIPDEEWTINHNLGFKPTVDIYDGGGEKVLAGVYHSSDNQVVINFTYPMSGFARLI